MIDSLIKTYKCENCKSSVSEQNISIIGAAGKTVNISIECQKCKKNSMVKMEVVGIDLEKLNISKEKLLGLTNKINSLKTGKLNSNIENKIKETKILDEEIVNLSKNMKGKSFKVDDLFKN